MAKVFEYEDAIVWLFDRIRGIGETQVSFVSGGNMKTADFEQLVATNIQAELAAKSVDGEQVSGVIDWLAIVSLLIENLLPMLSNCFSKAKPEDVASRLIAGGPVARLAIKNAVDATEDIQKPYRHAARAGLLKSCTALSQTDAESLIKQLENDGLSEVVNWSLT